MTFSLNPRTFDWYLYRKMRQEMWARLTSGKKRNSSEWNFPLKCKWGDQEMIRPISSKALVYDATERIKKLAEPKASRQNRKYIINKTLQNKHKEVIESMLDYERSVFEEKNIKTVFDEIDFSIKENETPGLISQKKILRKEQEKSLEKRKALKVKLKTAIQSLHEYEKSLQNKKCNKYKETSERTIELAKSKNYDDYLNNLVNYVQQNLTKSSALKYRASDRIKQLAKPKQFQDEFKGNKTKEQLCEKQKFKNKRKTKISQRIQQLSQPRKILCMENQKTKEKSVNWKKVHQMAKAKPLHPDYVMPRNFDEINFVSPAAKTRQGESETIEKLSTPINRPDPRIIEENENAFTISKTALRCKKVKRLKN